MMRLFEWKRKMLKKPKMFQRMTKGMQEKINEKIPEKAHQIITDGIKNFVKLTLTGSQITTEKWKKYIYPYKNKIHCSKKSFQPIVRQLW